MPGAMPEASNGARAVDATSAAPRCTNCFAIAHALYCPLCGQKQAPPDLSVRGLLRELVQELLNADGRLRRTTRSLLLRPGEFVVDYLEGRRARHLPPVRTWLITTVLLFLVLGSYGGPMRFGAVDRSELPAIADIGIETGNPQLDLLLNARVQRQLAHFIDEPRALGQAVLDVAPQLGLVMMPLLTLALYGLFPRPGFRFGHHLVVAMALQGGAFVTLIAGSAFLGLSGLARLAGADALADGIAWPTSLLPAAMALQVVLALRRVYRRGWLATLLRASLLLLVYALLTLMAFSAALVIAFLTF
jgi:hypothetical protein